MTASSAKDLIQDPDPAYGEDVEFLAAFSQFFAVSRDLSATLETVAAGVARGLNAEVSVVLLLDEDSGDLVCHGSAGPQEFLGARVRPDQGILGRCLRRNAIEVVRGGAADAEIFGSVKRDGGGSTRTAACVPLAADGRPFGVIQAANTRRPGGFDRRDCFLLQTMANSAALAVSNARMSEALVRQEVVARELDLAAEIQRNLLPTVGPGGSAIFGLNRPIRQVSGDFFDFFPLPDQRIAFALGDVSGKGINAALLTAKVASLFRCLAKRTDDPADLMGIINREVHETTSRGMFVTMVVGTYDPATGRLRFANAGHEPPLLRLPDHSYRSFPAAAPPLGILPEINFETREVDLAGGEFYMFSDGLTEFRYGDGEELGVDGLIQMVEGLSGLPLTERLEAVLGELEREGWRVLDDLTVLAIDDAWVQRGV